MDVVGIGGGSLLVLLIEVPHTLHTHSRSSLYIYNAIQHLEQWLPVIRMQPHPDICSLRPVGAGERVTVAVGCMIDNPHTLHTHSGSILNTYKVFHNLTLLLKVIRKQPQM